MGLNNNFHSKSDNTSWFWQKVLAIFSPKIYKFNNCTNVSLYNESCVQQGNKTQSGKNNHVKKLNNYFIKIYKIFLQLKL